MKQMLFRFTHLITITVTTLSAISIQAQTRELKLEDQVYVHNNESSVTKSISTDHESIFLISQRNRTNSEPYIGVWKGRGYQSNNSQWSILIALTGRNVGSVVGTVAYPSLSCGGTLTLLSQTSNSLELREDITYGNSNCIDDGTVSLNLNGNNVMNYSWKKTQDPDSGNATGTLNRISGR